MPSLCVRNDRTALKLFDECRREIVSDKGLGEDGEERIVE